MMSSGARKGLPDLTSAWALARNIDVRPFPADDEQAGQSALGEHPRPGQVQTLVQTLIQHVAADPARLQAVASAARSRCDELAGRDATPAELHRSRARPHLKQAAMGERQFRT